MAQSDGFELIKRIRQSSDVTVREMPAAALTAYARAEDRMKAFRADSRCTWRNPSIPRELIVAVASLARRTNQGRP